MGMSSFSSWAMRAGTALVVLLAFTGFALPDDKPDDPALRKLALTLNDVTGSGPMAGQLQQLFDDEAGTKKLLVVAMKMTAETPQPLNRNATLLLAMAAEYVKDVDTSAAFYRLNAQQAVKLSSERAIAAAYVGLIQLYADNDRLADSEKVCKEFLAMEGEEGDALEQIKPLVLERMVLVIAKQGAVDRALKIVDELVKTDPRNFQNRALKGRVLRQAEKYDEAAKVYLDVIERVKRDGRLEKEEKDEVVDDYRYHLSNLYIEMGDVDKAAEQLKLLLAREPNNPTYNNDLGYIWADKGVNLAEAEKYIRRAIDEERKLKKKLMVDEEEDTAAYLDSLGWVLFKQGKAKEAKPYLLRAVKQKEGQHLEILDHLGDVHAALGEKSEAIAAWKKGVASATATKRDQKRKIEVEKKLKTHEEK